MNLLMKLTLSFYLMISTPLVQASSTIIWFDEVASCPDEPRGKTAVYKGSCYEFIPDKVNQPKARNMCALHGGHLVVIRNKEMQTWLESFIRDELGWVEGSLAMQANAGIWLGLVKDEKTSRWIWQANNGSSKSLPVEYTNWELKEPDAASDRVCTTFGDSTNFQWRASVCHWWPYDYSVICEYDGAAGLFGSKENIIGISVGVVFLFVLIILAISLWYCRRKRNALLLQLHGDQESPSHFKEHRILNTDNNIDIESTCSDNQHVPPHYGEVTENPAALQALRSNNYNYNIIIGSTFERPKVKDKDMSLTDVRHSCSSPVHSTATPCRYSRSISEPGRSPPSRLLSVASAPPMEDEIIEELDDKAEQIPLSREDSTYSNNLS